MQRIELPPDTHVPELGVLPPDMVETLSGLTELSEKTRIWIENRKVDCEADCAKARAEAVADGHRDGLSAFLAAAQAHNEARAAIADTIVELLRSCLSQVLGSCPKDSVLQACVASVLRLGTKEGDLTIKVAAGDFEAMSKAVAKLTRQSGTDPKILVVTSDTLTEGSCVFYTETDVLTVDREILTEQLLAALSAPDIVTALQDQIGDAA